MLTWWCRNSLKATSAYTWAVTCTLVLFCRVQSKCQGAKAELYLCFVSFFFISLSLELFPVHQSHLDPDTGASVCSWETPESRSQKHRGLQLLFTDPSCHSNYTLKMGSCLPFPYSWAFTSLFDEATHQQMASGITTRCRGAPCHCHPSSVSRPHAHRFTRSWGPRFSFQMHTDVCVQCEIRTWTGLRYVNRFVALALRVLG